MPKPSPSPADPHAASLFATEERNRAGTPVKQVDGKEKDTANATTQPEHKLNDAQHRAVVHPGEPLIVLAGPGTGKTNVITHRIVHQINTLGIEPESIVAVTFTTKAAGELRERLRKSIGASKADRVNASTFHALGMRILQRFGNTLTRAPWDHGSFPLNDRPIAIDALPLPASARRGTGIAGGKGGPSLARAGLIDSAQRRRLLRAIIQQADLLRSARTLALDDAASIAARAIDTLTELAVFPDDCHRFIQHWQQSLDQGVSPGTDRAALDTEALRAQRESLSRFTDVARAYTLYDRALRHAGLVAFSDLITLPIRLFRQPNSRAAAILRDRWRHFVVDEFQDVNPAQLEFLRQLAPPATSATVSGGTRTPDLCVVGDDDQAIYGFRGSDQRAFSRFAALWKSPDNRPPAIIELQENYRSAPSIVAVANSIISRSESRFAPDKVIRAASTRTPAKNSGVVGVQVTADPQSGSVIAAMVQTLRASNPDAGAQSIAVVTRNHLTTDRIVDALRLEGIPVRTQRSPSVLDDNGVKDVLAWVELIVNPASSYDARWLLTRPPTSTTLEDIAALERDYRRLRDHLAGHDPDADITSHIPDNTSAPANEALARHYLRFAATSPGAAKPIALAAARLLALHDQLAAFAAAGHTAEETIHEIIARTGVAHAELLSAPERTRRVAALVAMLRFAAQIQPRLDAPGDLRAFLAYYKDLDENDQGMTNVGDLEERLDTETVEREIGTAPIETPTGQSLTDTLTAFVEGIVEQPAPHSAPTDTALSSAITPAHAFPPVEVLNAHKAKGLEFDIVFVPCIGAVRGNYGASTGNTDDDSETPPDLLDFIYPELAVPAAADAAREEERRVFYVAATRARSRLILMSKALKSRSRSTHYYQELTDDLAVSPSIAQVGINDVFEQAARAGIRSASDSSTLAAATEEETLATSAFDRARREARLLAAEALDLADRADLPSNDLSRLGGRLHDAAARMAIIAHIEQSGAAPPDSLLSLAHDRTHAAKFAADLLRHARTPTTTSILTPGLKPPLHLSYSQIKAYLDCPRCYYLRHVLGLPERERTAEIVGSVVHHVIERYLKAQRAAEADLLPAEDESMELPNLAGAPPLESLLTIARQAFAIESARHAEIDREQWVRIEAILTSFATNFHRASDHILEIEQFSKFAFNPIAAPPKVRKSTSRAKAAGTEEADPVDLASSIGTGHILIAKIDRIDQTTLPDGSAGFRIIDYKTGRDTKALREPADDDLQLGIYALALNDLYGTADGAPLRGVAEYWLLSTGATGGIPLEQLNLAKVSATITKVIHGMLAGDFAPKKGCERECSLFEPSSSQSSSADS